MKKLTLEIKPKEGYGEIPFGVGSSLVTEYLGEAEELENIEDEDVFNTIIMNYWEQGITVFMEGMEKSVVACFETENPESTLFGKRIFDMDEVQITQLMSSKGYEVTEAESDESGEKRLGYDDAMLDFFFDEGELVAVNWGVLINEKGEIEEMP
jgi:hypothetical protein